MLGILIGSSFLLVAALRAYKWFSEQDIQSQHTKNSEVPCKTSSFQEPCIGCK